MSKKIQYALIPGLIFVGTLVVVFFGLRAFFAFREFRRHGPPPPFMPSEAQAVETDVELIRDWMTIPYISRTYHVHPKILFDALGISPWRNEQKNLAQLNEEFFPDAPGIIIESVKAAILANQPPSTPVVPTAIPTAPTIPANP